MRRLLIAALACLALSASAEADQRDPRLPDLFEQLKSAASLEAAQPIEAEIWTIWAESDNDDVNLLMGITVNAMAREDYATALELLDKMVEAAPDFAEGWNKRATGLYLMGEIERSHADVEKVLELEPPRRMLWSWLLEPKPRDSLAVSDLIFRCPRRLVFLCTHMRCPRSFTG